MFDSEMITEQQYLPWQHFPPKYGNPTNLWWMRLKPLAWQVSENSTYINDILIYREQVYITDVTW